MDITRKQERILSQRQKEAVTVELREYEPTTPLPLSSSKFNRGVRQMFEEMEISNRLDFLQSIY